jgi:hypothetical protein
VQAQAREGRAKAEFRRLLALRPAVRERRHMELLAALGDDGLWSWKSSPHVLWLAARLAEQRA